jgi:Ca2+-binding EF-hand superfamily protein
MCIFSELGMDRVEEAVNLFDKWDTRGTGRLTKAQFLRLMQQVIGANKFARGPIYQRLVELSFDYVDTGKSGSLDKRQFLASYNLLFSNERKQMALLLTKDFKGNLLHKKC